MFSMTLLMSAMHEIAVLNQQVTLQSYTNLGLIATQALTIFIVFFFLVKLLLKLIDQLQSLNKIGRGKEEEDELADEVL